MLRYIKMGKIGSGIMANLMILVKKEFQDLINSRMMYVILFGYFVVISFQIYYAYITSSNFSGSQNIGLALSNLLFSILSTFGPIVGIMIGCTSIANERYKNTLNTLLVKPLYRDTIINGKIIGSLTFLALIVGFSIVYFTILLFIIFGDSIVSKIYDYTFTLPFVFIITLVLISIFLAGSMLISLLIKDQAFALILGTILVFISDNLVTTNICLPLANLFPQYRDIIIDSIGNLTPTGPLINIRNALFNSPLGFGHVVQLIFPDLAKLLIFIIIGFILCYIVFVRSDIS